MKLTKDQKNAIILALDGYGHKSDCYQYGLPTYDEEHMALMREIIEEAMDGLAP